MARPIVLSNGELHVGLNSSGLVHDFYFPYVGFENHVAGKNLRHKVGVWVNGVLSWLDTVGEWEFTFRYPQTALIGHTLAKNEALGILLEFDDCVDAEISVFMRNIHVINLRNEDREVRLFMHQAFAIGDSRSNTDTAQYLPDSNAILHYRGRRAFIISGVHNDAPFDEYSVGLFGIEGHEGTYKDAEDGHLGGGNVEHGRVDSAIRFSLQLGPHSSERVHYWIAAGTSTREALYVHKSIKEEGVLKRLHATASWWHKWLTPALEAASKLPPKYHDDFIRSTMIIKSQIDKRGAIMASTDTTMLNYSRDAYAYSWPRDGAHVLWPLIRMGYEDEAYRFFEFCKRGIHPNGYLMHKYRADGALGSSWHPYLHDGVIAPPIQEDETALVLYVFAQFYQMHGKPQLLREFYEPMIKPMAEFMAGYVDDISGLPKPSYDLWEQIFSTTTYTTSLVYAALLAASDLAAAVEDHDNAVKWRSVAEDIHAAAHRHLFNTERGFFRRGIMVKDGQIEYDDVIDTSAFYGAYMFGLFDMTSPEVTRSVETLKSRFALSDDNHGLPRYEDDDYRRESDAVTGNWWFITSLWLAQYEIESGDPKKAIEIIDWILGFALKTGMLAEQIDPLTRQTIAPAPLTWSHAELLSTLLDSATDLE
ncbi:MAG: putative Glycoside hydrolase 15-related protein [Candidatus Saccharibacteria bacterium]|nr:putative Glycoside hydrolase 15-related protein [Candidatus Saccharibacteria bacterium]